MQQIKEILQAGEGSAVLFYAQQWAVLCDRGEQVEQRLRKRSKSNSHRGVLLTATDFVRMTLANM